MRRLRAGRSLENLSPSGSVAFVLVICVISVCVEDAYFSSACASKACQRRSPPFPRMRQVFVYRVDFLSLGHAEKQKVSNAADWASG